LNNPGALSKRLIATKGEQVGVSSRQEKAKTPISKGRVEGKTMRGHLSPSRGKLGGNFQGGALQTGGKKMQVNRARITETGAHREVLF